MGNLCGRRRTRINASKNFGNIAEAVVKVVRKSVETVPEETEEILDVHSIQLAKFRQPESNVVQAINARRERNFALAMQLLEEELRSDCNNGRLYVEMAKVHRDRGEL